MNSTPVRRLRKRSQSSIDGPLRDYEYVADRLGVSTRMVRRLWASRELRAVKVGRHVRFTDAEITRYISDNQAGGAA